MKNLFLILLTASVLCISCNDSDPEPPLVKEIKCEYITHRYFQNPKDTLEFLLETDIYIKNTVYEPGIFFTPSFEYEYLTTSIFKVLHKKINSSKYADFKDDDTVTFFNSFRYPDESLYMKDPKPKLVSFTYGVTHQLED